MRIPNYVSIGNWLFQVKDLIGETTKTIILELRGHKGAITIKKNSTKNKIGNRKVRYYYSKPNNW